MIDTDVSSTLFLVALAVFGIGVAIERFTASSPALSTVIGIAAAVMGIMALVTVL